MRAAKTLFWVGALLVFYTGGLAILAATQGRWILAAINILLFAVNATCCRINYRAWKGAAVR